LGKVDENRPICNAGDMPGLPPLQVPDATGTGNIQVPDSGWHAHLASACHARKRLSAIDATHATNAINAEEASKMATNSTRISRRINAPRAMVYHALLDARAVAIWMAPDGMTSEVHAFDARQGGLFRISLTYDTAQAAGKTTAQTDTYHGSFFRLVQDEQVVETMEFETADPAMQGEMTVTFMLTDTRDGGTEMLGIHDNLPPGVSVVDNITGWRMALDKLAALVEVG
jgi:uncharacterized protein YndB with AHSA1/START domain